MAKRTNLPTVTEHLEFGRAVKAFGLAMSQMLTGEADGLGYWRYGVTSKQTKAFLKVEKALDNLKNVMDSDICEALPMSDRRATRFYYRAGDPHPEELPTDKTTLVPGLR